MITLATLAWFYLTPHGWNGPHTAAQCDMLRPENSVCIGLERKGKRR